MECTASDALFLSMILTGATAFGVWLLAPSAPGTGYPFVCCSLVIAALISGRVGTFAALGVGGLAMALILPGAGFAVSDSIDAAGLIGLVLTGVLIAWWAGRSQDLNAAQSKQLDASLAEEVKTKAYLREITHRLGNDLSILRALCSLMGREAETESARRALSEMGNRISLIGGIYRKLRVPEGVDSLLSARAFLSDLCDDLRQTIFALRSISLRLDVEDILLPVADVVTIGLIANELLTNVTKHAFPENRSGAVSLSFRRHKFRPNLLELVIIDDGIGFAMDRAPTEGLGNRILRAMAAQLGGNLIYARIDGATVATVEFPDNRAPHHGRDVAALTAPGPA